ncbi:MAG: O-antigen ligase family protein [Nitrospirae bacterium]|nr:MAG: O-antigen ligase family protein [Nitrospirota bacterium]
MEANKGLLILVALALAAALGMLIVSNEPTSILPIFLGLLLLIIAFLSTTASLYILVFSMLLSPEFMTGDLSGGGGAAGRGITLRFDDILLVVIGFVWFAKRAFFKGSTPFARTPLNGPIMFYIAMAIVATLIGVLEERVKGITGFFYLLKYYEYVLIYFMVVGSVETEKQAKNLLIASLVTCFFVSLFAISQIPGGERASAPFEGETGEPNTLGGYLVFMLSIITGLILTPGSLRRQWPLYVLLVLGVIGLFATLSRSSFLAAGVVVLVLSARLLRRKPIIAPIILIALIATPWWAPEAVSNRILFTFTQPMDEGQIRIGNIRVDTSTSDRLRSWQQGAKYWQAHPIWGTGVTGGPFMDAMYPRILTETGTVGLVAFFILIGALFRMGWAAYRQAKDPFQRGVAMGFLLGFVSLLVHAVGANSFIIVRIMEPFWLVAALVARGLTINQAAQPVGGAVQPDLAKGMRNGMRPTVPALRGYGAGKTMNP